MAKETDDRTQRRGGWVPYGLLSPGVVWLALFFLVPLLTLVRVSLSTQESRFEQKFSFTWEFKNYSDVLSEFGDIFLRSFGYAGIATVLCIAIGYPMAYFIAFRGGRYRNLLLGLVVVPFFTSYLVRTIAWVSIMGDEGPFLDLIRALALDGALDGIGITDNGRLLATEWAVIGGLTYNFLPFMVLPIYVSLEKIDVALVEAAKDLYSGAARSFRKVTLPMSLPGVFAGTLLTFIPASGDFINAEFLGGPKNTMIGNVVQQQFLVQNRYTSAAAISLILMVIITAGVLVYAKVLGTEDLT
ncbi:MAG: ABC transporter permease [Actinomycetota bacterium]|nr:ABC transporter permease [Actinomycetota bacterium]